MLAQRPVGLTARQPPLCRVHDEQPPVGVGVDAHRERPDGYHPPHHHLVAAVGVKRDHLVGGPVGEPELPVVPAR